MRGHKYTEKELAWIKDNLNVGVFKNRNNFTDVFNAIHGTNISYQGMANALSRRGWKVKTQENTSRWDSQHDEWLLENYAKYNGDFVSMSNDFNNRFSEDKSASCIRMHLLRQGIHKPKKKQGQVNKGCFKPGENRREELPIGTIRHNNDGRPYIKVKLCNGSNVHKKGVGHNFKEPWWKPLQKKIWEDHYGEVPEGFVVCSLNGNPNDTDIKHIGLIDKRGTARMAKNGWWGMENLVLMKDAVTWCNLFYTVQDYENGGVQ